MGEENTTIDSAVDLAGRDLFYATAIAEAAVGGTGPRKLMAEAVESGSLRQNTIIFDITSLSEDQLPPWWQDGELSEIYAQNGTRDLPPMVQRRLDRKRKQMVEKFDSLYAQSLDDVAEIRDPVMRTSRSIELETLSANVDLAAYNLGLTQTVPSFLSAQSLITGNCSIPTLADLDDQIHEVSDMFYRLGYNQKTLFKKATALRRDIGLVSREKSVATFARYVEQSSQMLSSLLGFDTPLDIKIIPLAQGENKTGSSEYEGGGKAVLAFRESGTVTEHEIRGMARHEATHFANAMRLEKYFRETGDFFAAYSTMCTASAALEEGIAENAWKVLDAMESNGGNEPIYIPALEAQKRLKRDAILYAHWLAWKGIYIDKEKSDVIKERVEAVYRAAGFDEQSVASLSPGPVNPLRWNKSLFYTPFYGVAMAQVAKYFAQFRSPEEAYRHYGNIVSKKGPLTLHVLGSK